MKPLYSSSTCISTLILIAFIEVCRANLPPVFLNDMNNLVLSENTPVGKVVFTLRGLDPENSTIEFGLIGTDLLTVNSKTGDVSIAKQLDHEVNNTLNFFVTIEDKIKNGIVGENNIVKEPVTIIVLDENDNPPIFENVPYSIVVKEDTPVNTMIFSEIFVTDVDTIGNAIEVECVEDPYSIGNCDIFGVMANNIGQGSYSGGLILLENLNYDSRKQYWILLRATDGELNSTTKVNIHVEDVQNTPPIFTSGLHAEVSEDVSLNTLVLTLHAYDGDTGAPREIIYELVNGPLNFTINPSNGELRTSGLLDREALRTTDGIMVLTVKAKEVVNGIQGSNDPIETTVQVIIRIKDVNDSPPSFNKKEYYVNISEDASIGYALPNLGMSVEDPDNDINSVFSLRLEDISNMFSIEPELVTGSSSVTIKTNSALDYEDPNQRKFIILVIAKEIYTNPQLSSTATVTVSVMDTNDNAPTFDLQTYSASVSELASFGTYIATILAKDRDNGLFGEAGIIYELKGIGSEKFVVNSRTGVITIAECNHPGIPECLDYETIRKYNLSYVATDNLGKGHATSVPFIISLTDGNDNPPIFIQSVYEVHIDEGSLKFEPDLIVNAKDADELSHLSYMIASGNEDGIFGIDSDTGKIRISRNVTYNYDDNRNNFVLIVQVTDGKYTAAAEVNIIIDDINDHAPVFKKEEYAVSVEEDAEVGSEIIRLEAMDADFGLNAELNYFIKKGSFNDFIIDNSTGSIKIARMLDFDLRNTYNMEIIAVDHGYNTLTGRTQLLVNVINVNNKLPFFKPSIQKVVVMKDVEVGTVIHNLIAFDPDVNSSEALNFFSVPDMITAFDKQGQTITLSQYENLFIVEEFTGNVLLNKSLKHNPAAEIQIPVIVKDITAEAVQQGEGMLIISIMDINNSPPEFPLPWTIRNPIYNLQIQEELPVGTIVQTYTATDNDSSIAGYYIKPESEYFEINHGTGILQIKKQIDYEQLKDLNFTILTYDSGIPQLNASATVFVTVLDTNDNSPIFSSTEYNATIIENAPNETFIVSVKATDLDSNEFGRISYSLVGQYSDNFIMSSNSGDIFVGNSKLFDYEELNEITVQVVAYDNAPKNMRRSASVPVHIRIVDVNDNAPKFSQSVYEVRVKENILVNPPIPILQVAADDSDKNLYGLVSYKIVAGNHNDSFLLAEDTGNLFVRKSLYGKTDGFLLKIEARDENGNGEFSDQATIKVIVESINSYKPKFISPVSGNNTIELKESVPANYSLIIVKASDDDYGENGRISYHIKTNNSNSQETREFIINSTTGELRTKIPLRFQHRKRFEITLVAKDHGSPNSYETFHNLAVLLNGPNRTKGGYSEVETANSYHFVVEENLKPNSFIGQVISATMLKDEDIYYYLSATSDKSFHVDKLDGSLYTKKLLDREDKDEYNLLIFASAHPDFYISNEDERKILLNTTNETNIIRVHVTITDLNDNSPKFDNAEYYAAVNSMTKINTFVSNVQASDPDIGGSFVYYLSASNLFKFGENKSSGAVIPSPFNITQDGDLFTATYLNENAQHHFVVDVAAKESAYPEHEGFSKVYVWIFETNQLIRIILSRPVEEVFKQKTDIIEELSNITNYVVVFNDIKNHIEDNGNENKEWCDMFVLVVNQSSQSIVPVDEVLKTIDVKYDFLKDYYAGFAIENVVPALSMTSHNALLDPVLIASVGVVLILGIIAVIMVCCMRLRSSSYPQKKDALINKKGIIEDLNTTENPLWIEQKIKMYEEQELSMQVFNDLEQAALDKGRDYLQDENAYATIQQPMHHGFMHPDSVLLTTDVGDYATLSSNMFNATNDYEAAMGFQGSTFQVPESSLTSNQDS